jgi:benzoylformate decarboxylase
LTSRDRVVERRPAPAVDGADGALSAAFVMQTVARLMPPDAIVVEEAPTHRNAMHDHLRIRNSGGFYVGASGGLGYGLPAAVGVALGSPGRRVICLLGDGSSLYSIQALWTAAQHRLPISFVVLNNGGYAALKAFGRVMGMDQPPGVDLPGIRLPSIAAGFGCPASRVDTGEQFEAALKSSMVAEGPTLLDVRVDAAIESLY